MIELPRQTGYLYGKPSVSATFKQANEDFKVTEIPSFEPEGEGDHLFVYIRKDGENTDWVARRLAAYCQINPKDVGYAGKKDRHAVTEQWFSLHLPGNREIDWSNFGGETIQILRMVRHPRKLRLGALLGNRFTIRLRDVTDAAELLARSEKVRQGVPNYFGSQRFGFDYGNLDKGVAMLEGRYKERQRHKKGLYISAVRSSLFNHLLDQRIQQGLWDSVQEGDVLMINGSSSCFKAELSDDTLEPRFQAGELNLTCAMWGAGESMVTGAVREWESAQLIEWSTVLSQLENLGLKQERRAARLIPQNMKLEQLADSDWLLSFQLPSGAFATSVLRELCILQDANQTDHAEAE